MAWRSSCLAVAWLVQAAPPAPAPLDTNTMQPFCWPSRGPRHFIGPNICVWSHTFGDSATHKIEPQELPPDVYADMSAGTRLPEIVVLRGQDDRANSMSSATIQLALRTDVATSLPVTVSVPLPLRAFIVATADVYAGNKAASKDGDAVILESSVSRGLHIHIEAPLGTPPGGYSMAVSFNLGNNTTRRCVTWGPWSCARPYIVRVPHVPRLGSSSATAASSFSCPDDAVCHHPRWSWTTVGDMSFVHTSNGTGVFSEASTRILAKFPSFTWDGSSSCRLPLDICHGAMEATQLKQFALLKSANPNISTIFYHDSARAWTLPNAINVSNALDEEILSSRPEWYLRNTSGGLAIDPYETGWDKYDGGKNGCCEVYDHRNLEVRKAWIQMGLSHFNTTIARKTKAGRFALVDGVFADDGGITADLAESTWHIEKQIAVDFTVGHRALLEEATAAVAPWGGLVVQNGAGSVANLPANAFMFETFSPTNATIHSLFALAESGKLVQAHTDYYSGEKNPSTFDSLAAFLIGAAPGLYWSGPFGWESADDDDVLQRWLPEMDKPLGIPLGPPIFMASGIADQDGSVPGTWQRQFASGTMVEFVVEPNCQGTIRWGDGSVTKGIGGCDSEPTPPPGHELVSMFV